jgi:hypothetical protein
MVGQSSVNCYLFEKCVTYSTQQENYPYELLTGIKPDLSHIRRFGCYVVFQNMDPDTKKLDDRGLEGIFMGYSDEVKGYVIYSTTQKRLVTSRTVKFRDINGSSIATNQSEDNSNSEEDGTFTPVPNPVTTLPPSPIVPQVPIRTGYWGTKRTIEPTPPPTRTGYWGTKRTVAPVAPPRQTNFEEEEEEELSEDEDSDEDYVNTDKETEDFDTDHLERSLQVTAIEGGYKEPATYKEAARSPYWMEAIHTEYDGLVANNTWTLVPYRKGMSIIGCKWVFKKKLFADGTVDKYKARLVAKGYTQKEGVNYHATFAPVAKFSTIRTLFAVAAIRKLNVKQLDISTAYLNA